MLLGGYQQEETAKLGGFYLLQFLPALKRLHNVAQHAASLEMVFPASNEVWLGFHFLRKLRSAQVPLIALRAI